MKKFVRVLIQNKENVYLIIKEKREQDIWNFPGGKVEESEPLINACKREVFEETNLLVDKMTYLCKKEYEIMDDKWIGYYFLASTYEGNLILKERKSLDFSFISINEFGMYGEYIANAQNHIKNGELL